MAERIRSLGTIFPTAKSQRSITATTVSGTKFRHGDKWYYFKSLSERQKFIGNPEAYLGGGEGSDSND